MKNKKHIYTLLIFLVLMLSISAVSAAEDATSNISSVEDNEEIILEATPTENNLNDANDELILEESPNKETLNIENENELLTADGNFTDLNNLINDNTDTEISLDRNYTYSSGDNFANGITINREVTINGNGYTINANDQARIFKVTNSSVVFKNIIFINGNAREYGGAIDGACTAIDCTFQNNHAKNGGAMNNGVALNCTFIGNRAEDVEEDYDGFGGAGNSILAHNCTFINNVAYYNGGGMNYGFAVNCHFENNSIIDEDDDYYGSAMYEGIALNCTAINNNFSMTEIIERGKINATNYEGVCSETHYIPIKLYGIYSDGDQSELNQIDMTMLIFELSELIETKNFKSGSNVEINLPYGNYTAIVSVDNIPEIDSVAFNIKLDKTPTAIYAESKTVICNSTSYLEVFLKDGINHPVSSATILVEIDGLIDPLYNYGGDPIPYSNASNYTTDSEGKVLIPLKDLKVGTYTANISYAGNDTYINSSKTATINVTRIPVTIESETPYTFKYNSTSEDYLITVTDYFGKPVTAYDVYIDLWEDAHFVLNDEGRARVLSSLLNTIAGGTYETTIRFHAPSYFPLAAGEKNITIIVERQSTSMTSSDVTTIFNSDDKIVARITSEKGIPVIGAEVSIDVIPGESFTTDANGQVEIPTKPLSSGVHVATINFAGNENYTGSNYTINVTINKDNSSLSAVNVTTSIDNVSNLVISLKDSQSRPIANEKLRIFIKDVTEMTTDENGEVKISTVGLETNAYTVFIFYDGNENYNATNATAMINISKSIPKIAIDDYVVPQGETVTVNVSARDKDGNPISGIAKVFLPGYEEEGYLYYVPIDETGKGQVQITPTIREGDYRLRAIFVSTDKYAEAQSDRVISVKGPVRINLEVSANEADFGEDTILTVKVTDIMGEPATIRKMNITIGEGESKQYDVVNGTINLGKLDVGTYPVQVTTDNPIYIPATANITVTVNPASGVQINASAENYPYDTEGKLVINVTDNNDQVLDGTITVVIDGNPYKETEITAGHVEIPLNDLTVGPKAIEVIFSNPNYLDSSVYVYFNVTKATPVVKVTGTTVEYGKPATVKVTASSDGLPIEGKVIITVDWEVDGLTEVVDLEEGTGEATFVLDAMQSGNYSITATYIANDNYAEAVNDTEKVTVTPSTEMTIEVTVSEAEANKDVIITVTATDGAGAPVTVEKVNVTKGNETEPNEYPVDENGSVNIGKLPIGETNITVSVNDGIHAAVSEDINIKVEPTSGVQINASAENYPYDTEGKLVIDVTDISEQALDGTITLVIDGNPYKETEITAGHVEIPLNDLTVGPKAIEVIFSNPNYLDSSVYVYFNVTKATPVVRVTGTTVEYGKPATVKVTASSDGLPIEGKVIITVDWEVDGLTEVVDLEEGTGEATFVLDAMQSGNYSITATYIANDNYAEAVNDTEKVTVTPSTEMTIEVTVSEAEANKDVIITVTATDGAGAPVAIEKINVTIEGVEKEYPVEEDNTVNIGKLPGGEKTATISVNDGTHAETSKDIHFIVEPTSGAMVIASADDYIFTGTGTLVINATDSEDAPLSGTITVEIDGEPYDVKDITDGHLEIELKNLPIGAHTANVIFTNPNYLDCSYIAHFNVSKATPEMTVIGSEEEWGETSSVTIIVTDSEGNPVSGTVIVRVDWAVDCVYDVVELDHGEGQALFILTQVEEGEYDVKVNFTGTDEYNEVINTDAKVIIKPSTHMHMELNFNKPTNETDAIVTINAEDGRGAEINVTRESIVQVRVDSTPVEFTMDDEGNINIGKLLPGEHEITVVFNDGYHDETTESGIVFVDTLETVDTYITVTTSNISYGDNETIEFTLTDEKGDKLSATLNVTVGNVEYPVNVINGTGSLTLEGLNADTYPVVANYKGEGHINPSTGTTSFNVAKNGTKIIFKDMTTVAIDKSDVKTGQWFTWKLVDANGNPIANAPTQIGFNGVVYENIRTDANGLAKLQINLAYKGPYTFAISFLGDQNYNASFVVAKITVNTQTPNIIVPNKSYKATAKTKTLTATFKSKEGTLIANKKVSFTVNGKTYTAKTNAKGVASVNVAITKKGSYKVTAKFAGDSTYSAVTKTATLKLS